MYTLTNDGNEKTRVLRVTHNKKSKISKIGGRIMASSIRKCKCVQFLSFRDVRQELYDN